MYMDPKLLAAAVQYHRAGDVAQAQALYRQLLAAEPRNVEVLNLLGAASLDLGAIDEAAAFLAEALRLDPALAPAHDNLGLVLRSQGRLGEAAASFRRALALDPRNAQTQRNLAQSLLATGQLAGAIDALRQVTLLGPADVRAHFELAAALAQAGRNVEAIAAYQAVLRLKSDVVEACLNLASLCFGENAFDEAVRWSRRASELRPDLAEAHCNLGCALAKLERFDEAIGALQTAVDLKPQMKQAVDSLGAALVEGGRIDAALEHYRRAVAARPEDPDIWYGLGSAYLKTGDVSAALEHYDRALAVQPEHAAAGHNRLALRLLQGKLLEAFPEYESRFRSQDAALARWPWKRWNGEPLAGRTLVLSPEPGFGDTLQFVRYAPAIQEQGARVVMVCNETQKPILARTPGIDALITPETAIEADYFVPLISLPHRMQTALETIPADIPYVFAEPGLVAAWQRRLAPCDGFKVGIVWQGNPLFPGDRQRSIPLARFAPLASVPGVRLVNLQKGPGLEQLSAVGAAWSVLDFGAEVDAAAGAFMDTAAIMKNLDLVISSDTGAAHLAGALGVPVWVALQRVPDWRWLLEREDSPWYPTMRLFRQTRPGDWAAVFERMAGELARLVGQGDR
jgi:tetratricopeptide (TPR) repeat protein